MPSRPLCLAGFVAGLIILWPALAAPARAQTAPAPAARQGVPVQVATATVRDVPVLLRNIGTVQSLNTVLVRARVDGTIESLPFTEGQDVTAGQPLAIIDPRPYATTLAAARAKLAGDQATMANAQRDLGRTNALVRSDFASHQQQDAQRATVQTTQAAMDADQAAIARAQLDLDYATVRAPIDGRVGLRLVDPGNLVHATDATGIVTVTQIHPIAVVFTLPQESLPQVQAAMARGGDVPVAAYAADDQHKLADGVLLTIDSQVDPATGTIRLKATFPNADRALWPGQFVNARLRVATLAGVVTVPSIAVQHGPDGLYVFRVNADWTVANQPVQVVQDQDGVAVIGRGLEAGAQVVTNGQSRLRQGVTVAVAAPPANG